MLQFEADYKKYLTAVCLQFVGQVKSFRVWYDTNNVLHFNVEINCSRFNAYSYNQIKTAVNKAGLDLISFDFFGTVPLLELHFVIMEAKQWVALLQLTRFI